MKFRTAILALGFVFVAGCQSDTPATTEPNPSSAEPGTSSSTSAAAAVAYADVEPIFKENCVLCHGEQNPKEGIKLTSYANILAGAPNEEVVKPGDVEGSLLAHVLRASHGEPQMPPAGPLPEEKIKQIEKWIEGGAKE